MIKTLRKRFILIAMGSFALVVLIIIGSINGVNFYQTNRQIDAMLEFISQNGGDIPLKNIHPDDKNTGFDFYEETRFATRYFTVRIAENGDITELNTGHIAAIDSDDAAQYAKEAFQSGKTGGFRGSYKFLVTQSEGQTLIVFVDCRAQLDQSNRFLMVSAMTAIAGLLVVCALIAVLSKKAIKPFAESVQKQKRFITDAGHELKTPIAIISANADVLKLSGCDNEWVDSIKHQTARMSELVTSLLTLSKASEFAEKKTFLPFSLSDAVSETAGQFLPVAIAENKNMKTEIEENISYTGDERSIRELVSILCDNAVKYADGGGDITVSLCRHGKKTTLLVSNTSTQTDMKNLDRLFDRFYRADEARSRESGGFGIGLSVAAAVAEAHGAKIYAEAVDEKTVGFYVIF